MRICQFKLFYTHHTSALLKTILLLILLLFCFFNLSAQKESNFKLKIETGVLWDLGKGEINLNGPLFLSGLFLNVEPKLKTSKNTVFGLRIGTAVNTQAFKNSDVNQFLFIYDSEYTSNWYGIEGNNVVSFVPTFDYSFNEKNLRPYLGVGVGYYFLTTCNRVRVKNSPELIELSVNNKVSILLRGGLEVRRYTVGLEFNFIPKADVEIPNGQIIGTLANSNVGLSIGYTIGLGERLK